MYQHQVIGDDSLPRGAGNLLVVHCHLVGLDTLDRRTGNRQAAQDRLGTAATTYRELDVRFWLEPALSELQ